MQKKEHLLSLIISYITAKNTICQSFLFSAKDFFSDKIFVKISRTFSFFLKVFVGNSSLFSIPIGIHWFYHIQYVIFLLIFIKFFIDFHYTTLYKKKEKVFLLYNIKHLFPFVSSKSFDCQNPNFGSTFFGSSMITRSAFSSIKCSSLCMITSFFPSK